MPQVTVTIAGKAYRMACADGEEAHLAGLAALFDGKIAEMRKAFGEIGDMRLQVMAALTIADELAEARRTVAALEAELEGLRHLNTAGDARSQDLEARAAEGIARAEERIERLARGLTGPAAQG
ncbi:MAG: cell division protein ZapA [Pseudomonadota bacterium]|nr:cell division protein ZapA [Pseudomonadota bacterium]